MRLLTFKSKFDPILSQLVGHTDARKRLPVILICNTDKKMQSKISSLSGQIKHVYNIIDGIACNLSPSAIEKLAYIPEVRHIFYDQSATLCLQQQTSSSHPSSLHPWHLTGLGVGVGIIDTGVFPHPDLCTDRRSIKYFCDLLNGRTQPYDDHGHGTFLCGCIAGSGTLSNGRYTGIAQGAGLYVVKAFNNTGVGRMSDIIVGIQTLLLLKETEPIRILCLPFIIGSEIPIAKNPLELALQKVVSAGMSVIVPAGNRGPNAYTIGIPGTMEDVITIGGVDATDRTIENSTIAEFSGRGPTYDGRNKPDLVAGCCRITSLATDPSYRPGIGKPSPPEAPYSFASGTSIACAIVSAYAALLLEKHSELSSQDIKSMLCLLTKSIGADRLAQGFGIFSPEKLNHNTMK